MEVQKLHDMKGGWFVGDFTPVVLQSPHVEVAIKRYRQGDREAAHVHKVAREITLVVSGQCRMTLVDEHGIRFNPWLICQDEMVILAPGEAVEFEAVTDCVCCVVKAPSVAGDKYPV